MFASTNVTFSDAVINLLGFLNLTSISSSMVFISYAQNLEDVMLWRSLQDVGIGFYIDVGAAWPNEHSVTKSFYDRGWHGINIEPNPQHWENLCSERPRDINLKVAVGLSEGSIEMNFIEGTGLSTSREEIAYRHAEQGWTLERQTADAKTLKSICQAHIKLGQEVHFLKVDVEGRERDVILGHDWLKYRPWIVLVEATEPMSQIDSYAEWEIILLSSNYNFAYADGLNRFYVAGEHSHLMHHFRFPPNVFDNFVSSQVVELQEKILIADQQAHLAAQQIQLSNEQIRQTEELVHQTKALLQVHIAALKAMHQSTSWRLTQPMRMVGQSITMLHRLIKRTKNGFFPALSSMGFLCPPITRQDLVMSSIRYSKKLGLAEYLKPLYLLWHRFRSSAISRQFMEMISTRHIDQLSCDEARVYWQLKASIRARYMDRT